MNNVIFTYSINASFLVKYVERMNGPRSENIKVEIKYTTLMFWTAMPLPNISNCKISVKKK